ncbi:uncharacterized protein LOC143486750 isoform X2 [Brachyhypopomus gauderio]|uniref:uncharacterized protein LOC143486750 isoform X2 n=1 Tax=Brachyhypopomus gauderio TaxID=698409 RepID=UPI0040432287
MSVETDEDVLSGIESLSNPPSPSVAPPPAPPPPTVFPLSSATLPSVRRSWPSSPLSASRQVTAHLYSSLQRSKDQEVKGYSALPCGDLSAKTRQVSFKLSSPELCSVTMPTVKRSLCSDRLSESQEADCSLDACSSQCIVGEEVEQMTEDMDLNLQSSSGRWHIEEMQNVRSHLQTILNTDERITEETDDILGPTSQYHQDDSQESDTTSHLLSASVSLGIEELFPRYSRLRGDVNPTSLHSLSELQATRERLERERDRRKHSEQQVLALQTKALTLQQQLAMAVSADRKKDIMIEQLDKTLEKVVEGWSRHEQDKSEKIKRLQQEKETAMRTQDTQREALVSFEKSLSEAAETLDKEQKRNEKLQKTNKQLEQELAELRVCVEELRQQGRQLQAAAEEQRAETDRLQIKTQALQAQLEEQSQEAQHTHTHLQQDITLLTQQLERERERVGLEVQLREEAQSRLQQLQQDLDEARRERDAERVDRALDQARFEAQCSQREVELRLAVEQQVTERLSHIQQDNNTATAKLREQHRKQLLDLRDHHERELSAQVDEFRVQLQERDTRQHQLTLQFNNRMAELQEQLGSMETSKRRLEMQREELVSRLQGMMRSHWTEALRLLTNPEQVEGSLPSLPLYGTPRTPSCPEAEDTKSVGTVTTVTTAAPQAVVLHLSRERQRGQGAGAARRVDDGGGHSDFGLLNHTQNFTPLEPVLDETNLTVLGGDLSTFWDKPLEGVKQNREREMEREGGRERDRGREGMEKMGGKEDIRSSRERACAESGSLALNPKPVHYDEDSYTHVNQIRSQVERSSVNRQVNHIPVPICNLNQMQSSSERQMNPMCSLHSTTGAETPPIKEQSLSVKERVPPTVTSGQTLHEDRQNELQYYISKLLDRSPGEPLKEQPVDQRRPDLQSVGPDVSSECFPRVSGELDSLHTHSRSRPPGCLSELPLHPQLEQLTSLLRVATPSANTTHATDTTHAAKQLHQLLSGLLRSGEPCTDTVRANLDQKLTQHEKKERQAPPRPTQSTTSRRHHSGSQGLRPGSKVNVWK